MNVLMSTICPVSWQGSRGQQTFSIIVFRWHILLLHCREVSFVHLDDEIHVDNLQKEELLVTADELPEACYAFRNHAENRWETSAAFEGNLTWIEDAIRTCIFWSNLIRALPSRNSCIDSWHIPRLARATRCPRWSPLTGGRHQANYAKLQKRRLVSGFPQLLGKVRRKRRVFHGFGSNLGAKGRF